MLETRVRSLESKLDQLLKAAEKSDSKKNKSSNGEERESAGTPTCWSCGKQGHVRRFCKKQKRKKAATSNSPSNSDSSASKALENQ